MTMKRDHTKKTESKDGNEDLLHLEALIERKRQTNHALLKIVKGMEGRCKGQAEQHPLQGVQRQCLDPVGHKKPAGTIVTIEDIVS